MTPADFRARLEALFGPVATTQRAAQALRVDRRTLDRWRSGERAIPGPVWAWLDKEDECRHWKGIVEELLAEATAPTDER